MRIKTGYILREVAGQNIVIPADDENAAFQGALTLNGTGAFIWKRLETGSTRGMLVSALTEKYDVDAEKAAASVDRILATFEKYGVLER